MPALSSLSTLNASFLDTQFAGTEDPSTHDRPLAAFAEFVDRYARIAVNMGAEALHGLLTGTPYRSARQRARHDAAGNAALAAALLKSDLDVAYDLRNTFEHAFSDGTDLVYGFLYAGGDGASGYGSYCAILRDDPERVVALLARDSIDLSLRYFLLGAAGVDMDKVQKESASWERRGRLATLKLRRGVTRAKHTWPTLVASRSEYIEVLLAGEIQPCSIERVVVEASRYAEWSTDPVRYESWVERKRFDRIRVLAEARGVPIQSSDDFTRLLFER